MVATLADVSMKTFGGMIPHTVIGSGNRPNQSITSRKLGPLPDGRDCLLPPPTLWWQGYVSAEQVIMRNVSTADTLTRLGTMFRLDSRHGQSRLAQYVPIASLKYSPATTFDARKVSGASLQRPGATTIPCLWWLRPSISQKAKSCCSINEQHGNKKESTIMQPTPEQESVISTDLAIGFIPLSNSPLLAEIDAEDLNLALTYSPWYLHEKGYVTTNVPADTKTGQATLGLHTLVWRNGIPEGMMLDHIDRNKRNNRKNNLRLATNSQNCANRPGNKNHKSSRFKGVYPLGKNRYGSEWFIAILTVKGERVRLGPFPKEETAALAYNEAALKHFGEFAYQNKV